MKLKCWLNRILVLAIAACMLLSCLPLRSFAETTEENAKTEETLIPEDAIYLTTVEDVMALAENCVSDVWSRDKTVVLRNDIDMTGVEFAPIPTFGGTFLGQGFTISGIQLTDEKTVLGFFRYLQKTAVVEDLHLNMAVQPSKSGNTAIGGFVGINYGTIRNCSFSGIVSGNEQIGGIAGRNKVSGVIENCTVSGVVYGDHYIGGIAGENQGVIRQCINLAEVNTQVDHNSVSLDLMSGISLDSFTAKESISDATNIGGIAGTSSGVIRGCENRANIGYEKMGYNVGGIAGSQIGYITESVNYGTINGSDGVGGIVGQFKPNVVLEFGSNPMDTMTEEMSGMMASMSSLMSSMSGMLGNMSFDMDNLEDSMDLLKDPENWDPDSMNAALNDMSKSFNELYENMSSMGSDVTNQMDGMMSSIDGMVNSMEELSEGIDIKIIDVSKEDTAENSLTKVCDCANYGSVYGETYVGGITGLADVEDTTLQEEIDGQISFSSTGEVIVRLVIRDCRNYGDVSATKQYAGGIVGNMTIGAVFAGLNTGNLDSLNADYVGGIAGSSDTYIFGSFSRSILAGGDYVGGIAGFGTEVVGCYAVSDIAASTKFAGGILGYAETLPDEEASFIIENYYYLTGKNLGGIDGISYDGATGPMTLEEFLGLEDLDDMFRTVTVRFLAQGQEDTVMTVDMGGSVSLSDVPVLAVDENEIYEWEYSKPVTAQVLGMGETEEILYLSEEKLTNILFSQTYEAEFNAKHMVVQSENKTENNRSLILAIGAFDKDTSVQLVDMLEAEPTVNGIAVLENWQVEISNIGVEKLHYRIPEGVSADSLNLYVKDASGCWTKREFQVEGSYMIFEFTDGETAFALEELPDGHVPIMVLAFGAGIVILLLVLGKAVKSRRKKKGASGEK